MQQGITSAVNPADGNSLSYPAGSLGALEDGVIDLQNLGEWRSELSMEGTQLQKGPQSSRS